VHRTYDLGTKLGTTPCSHMSDRTNPHIDLQQVPTRVADIREFERELIAAAETPDHEPLDADEAPTRFIQIPQDRYARDAAPLTPDTEVFAHRTAPVPVATVITRLPQPAFRTWLTVFIVLSAVGAINVGLLLGLYTNDETDAIPPATAAMGSVLATEASAPAATAPAVEAPARHSLSGLEVPAEPKAEEHVLSVAQRAIEAADVDAATVALDQARDAGAEPASLDRLRAQLMVLRGDAAAAVPELRAMTSVYADDAAIWLALARVLAQAEHDDAAERAFLRVLELDEHSVDAHVGIARLATRGTRLRTSRQHLGSAREAYERGEPDPVREARLHVTEGIIGFELGDYAGASSLAERALALDEKSAEAHLLLGRIAIQQERDASEHLWAAVAGRAPPAEALGMLVPRAGESACELADRYLIIAPTGYDVRAVRRAQRDCR